MNSVAASAVVIDFQAFRTARLAQLDRIEAQPVAEQRAFDWHEPVEAARAASDSHRWDVLGPADAIGREIRQAPHRARMLEHLAATALCSGHVPSE